MSPDPTTPGEAPQRAASSSALRRHALSLLIVSALLVALCVVGVLLGRSEARLRSLAAEAYPKLAHGHAQQLRGALADVVRWGWVVFGLGLAVGVTQMLVLVAQARRGQQRGRVGWLAERVQELARGGADLRQRIEMGAVDPEVGAVASGVNDFVERVQTLVTEISEAAGQVARASSELRETSRHIDGLSQRSAEGGRAMLLATRQVNDSVSSVVATIEELGASIAEIASSATDARRISHQAVDVAEQANQAVAGLGRRTDEIGGVLRLINSIAEATNMLALNATIEAARAGEAGKGFSVVASEVKELSRRTAAATDEIQRTVEAIGEEVLRTTRDIGQITEVVHAISNSQTQISAAVEQQSAGSAEIGQWVSEASQQAGKIEQRSGQVSEDASQVSQAITRIVEASEGLAEMAERLQARIARFRY